MGRNRIEEILSSVEKSTPRPSIEDTLALVGASMSKIDQAAADLRILGSSRENLEMKLANFRSDYLTFAYHSHNFKKAANKLGDLFRHIQDHVYQLQRDDILQSAFIQFVYLLEEANEYFEFKIIAKQAHHSYFKRAPSPIYISNTLLQDYQLQSKFPKIGETDIYKAANAIYWEHDSMRRGEPMSQEDDPALDDWIHKLVFRAREEGYVMDQDPIVELGKMMKSKPNVFDGYFLIQELPVKCTTRSAEEARNKYSQLVSIMGARYEKQKLTSTGVIDSSPRKRKRDDEAS